MQLVLSAFKTNPLTHAAQRFCPPHVVQLEILQIKVHLIDVVVILVPVRLQLEVSLMQLRVVVIIIFFLYPGAQNSQTVLFMHIWQLAVLLRHEGKQALLFVLKVNPL